MPNSEKFKKRILITDLDGPILNVSERHYRVYNKCIKELGGIALDKNTYWNLKRLKIPDCDILSMTSDFCNDFKVKHNLIIEEKEMLKLDSVWEDIWDTYQSLCNRIPIVLVTLRTYSERTFWQLKSLNIYSWFCSILSHPASNINEGWKTKVELITKSALLKNIDIKDCVFVGDTETDILAGKYMGMKTIGVSFGIRTKELLSAFKPDLIFDKPIELSSYLQEYYLKI